jgi:hypothetical protein
MYQVSQASAARTGSLHAAHAISSGMARFVMRAICGCDNRWQACRSPAASSLQILDPS